MEFSINPDSFDFMIDRYLQYPRFKATVDRLREEQKMTLDKLTQTYWPSSS